MQKYGASSRRFGGRVVVAENDDNVVHAITAPQMFRPARKRQSNRLVIGWIYGVVTPSGPWT